jgi:hypothetical protein
MIQFILAAVGGALIGNAISSKKRFDDGGQVDNKIPIKSVTLTTYDGGVIVKDASVAKANEALYYFWKRQAGSDAYYFITFDDGETLEGSIDLEPHSFHEDHKHNILTWHINTFWNNFANSDYSYISKEDKEDAKRLIENYRLYKEGGNIEDILKETTEEQYYDMLGAVPPIYIHELNGKRVKGFAVGEAYSHINIDDKTKATYIAYLEANNKYYKVKDFVYFVSNGIAKTIDSHKMAKGGWVEGEWVVYNPDTYEPFSLHKSHRSAKIASDKLFNTGEYDGVGSTTRDEFEKKYKLYFPNKELVYPKK